ncbi:23S rRNA (adenine2503-C2)-methyltransferase [Haloferula luteola]|uniref:23S rRNA (Adenine2503-C2)-methyltransferase n=1 Tax=Haloferula luteola TaxID=595692 RepID=A0A840UUD4_9BACT|nr:23S rRNA (adenine(2503)-C(2))-methyltransferase RlmN [Haloferula luteola]MBB5349807.1 23S rRNA (adenine2503-C2)-methyltransferase [Haloferula luteola]
MSDALDGLRLEDLRTHLVAEGVNAVHAAPLFRWLQTGHRGGFEPPLERWLERQEDTLITPLRRVLETTSEDGWTTKFLFELADGAQIESVLMGFPGRFTACLSTQVGCAMGCVFCATGQMGFRRHLKAGEIVAQAREVSRLVADRYGERVRNVVMMGMGEPLHNYDATLQALAAITDTHGMGVGPSRVTLSTVGHVPGILKLAKEPAPYTLAVSLHGADDEERGRLIPVNRRWPLAELIDAMRVYQAQKGRILVAWTIIDGVNDSPEHARKIVNLLKGLDIHVNVIPLNATEGFEGSQPESRRVIDFQRILKEAGLPATVRQRRGLDVAAGCGQLVVKSEV